MLVKLLSRLFLKRREFSLETIGSFIKITTKLCLKMNNIKIKKVILFFNLKCFKNILKLKRCLIRNFKINILKLILN